MNDEEIELDVDDVISNIYHPMINFPLTELGIIRSYEKSGKHIHVIFAFPFPNIPIADQLIGSVKEPLEMMGYSIDYETELMNEAEKAHFLALEKTGWKK